MQIKFSSAKLSISLTSARGEQDNIEHNKLRKPDILSISM